MPLTPLGELTMLPRPRSRLRIMGFPSPTTPMASRLGASAKVPLFVESKKILKLYYATLLSALWALRSNRY